MTSELFADFLKAGLYLRGWSKGTAVVYQRAWDSLTRFQESLQKQLAGQEQLASHTPNSPTITKAHLEAWVISRRQAGMSPAGINIYIRSLNSFFSWLNEEGHTKDQLVLKQLKASVKPIEVFSDVDLRKLLSHSPRSFYELRTWTLLCLLLDTGCRVSEILDLHAPEADFDNLLLSVKGKGNKHRKVPFSPQIRKSLFRYQVRRAKKRVHGDLVFSTRDGLRLRHRNVYRDFGLLCRHVGITKHVHPHLTRHTFACHFMKNGGSIYSLSRILGHASISTTQVYIRGLGVEDFREEQARLSPMACLGR